MIKSLPIRADHLDWSDPAAVDELAFSSLLALKAHVPANQLDEKLRWYYALSDYDFEVKNGGHSQLIHNLLASDELWVLDDFPLAAEAIGAEAFGQLAQEYVDWLIAHPDIAASQTGFQGGRASELDRFDARYMRLDSHSEAALIELRELPCDADEAEYLDDASSRAEAWQSDFGTLKAIWLKRSGIVVALDETAWKAYWGSLGIEAP